MLHAFFYNRFLSFATCYVEMNNASEHLLYRSRAPAKLPSYIIELCNQNVTIYGYNMGSRTNLVDTCNISTIIYTLARWVSPECDESCLQSARVMNTNLCGRNGNSQLRNVVVLTKLWSVYERPTIPKACMTGSWCIQGEQPSLVNIRNNVNKTCKHHNPSWRT